MFIIKERILAFEFSITILKVIRGV